MSTEIKERILNSMEKLASEKGFAGTTTDELAAEAGISKRTLYRYFTGKEKVIEGVVHRLTGRVERATAEIEKSDLPPLEKFKNITALVRNNVSIMETRGFLELQKHYPHLWEYIDEFRATRIKIIEGILEEGIKNGDFKPVNPRLTTNAFLASVRHIINPGFLSVNSLSLDEALNDLVELFLYGIKN